MKKIVPLVACEVCFCQYVCESTYLISIFGSRLILSNNKSRATLWVPDTCLIVGLLPLMTILITASLSTKCRASHRIEKTSRSTKHNQQYSIQDCRDELEPWFGFGCACLMWCHATSLFVLDLWFSLIDLGKNESLQ